jgi:hypothetical protein
MCPCIFSIAMCTPVLCFPYVFCAVVLYWSRLNSSICSSIWACGQEVVLGQDGKMRCSCVSLCSVDLEALARSEGSGFWCFLVLYG